ncbi:MAG: hypothetical protein LBS72_07065 [Oscillospiraceae bacterium]|nr:hypothetical protein [Oscillospiraceae bacterium]
MADEFENRAEPVSALPFVAAVGVTSNDAAAYGKRRAYDIVTITYNKTSPNR